MNSWSKIYNLRYVTLVLILFIALTKTEAKEPQVPLRKIELKASVSDSIKKGVLLKELMVIANKRKETKSIGKEEISLEEISRQMIISPKDIVRYLPGIGISETGSRFGNRGFAIRGVEDNRVAVSVDNIMQAEPETNVAFSAYGLINSSRPQFETEFIRNVEIEKGASSFDFGSGALGGAVNYTTKDVNSIIKQDRYYGVSLKSGIDTKNRGRLLSGSLAGRYKGFEVIAMYALRTSAELNNFSRGDLRRNVLATKVDPTLSKQGSFLGKISYTQGEHKLALSYYTQNKITDTDVWSMEPSYVLTSKNEPYYYGHDQVLSLFLGGDYLYKPRFSKYLNEIKLSCNNQLSFLDANTRLNIYQPSITNFDPQFLYAGNRQIMKGLSFKDYLVSLRVLSKTVDFVDWGLHLFNLQANFFHHHTSNNNVDINSPINLQSEGVKFKGRFYQFGEQLPENSYSYSFQRPVSRNNFSLSFSDNIAYNEFFDFKLGLRFDYFRSESLDWEADNDFNYMSYMIDNLKTAGMNFDKAQISEFGFSPMIVINSSIKSYFNISYKFSTGYRVPSSQERFFQYVSLSPAFFVLSNHQLKKETSINNEIDFYSKNLKWGTYRLAFYLNNYNNYIEPDFGVQTVFLEGQNKDIAYSININKKKANLMGTDLSVGLFLDELFPALKVSGTYVMTASASYSKGAFSDGTSMLSVQPLTAVLGFDFDTKKKNAGLSFKMTFLKAKDINDTRFVESFYGNETLKQFPYKFFQNNLILDLYGYVNITKHATLRASVFNLTNQRYWLWDDLRQVINPVLLSHYKDFFSCGLNSMTRFTQPRRFFNVSLEIKI